MKEQLERMLTESLIPFWSGLRDETYGGYTGWVGYDLQRDPKADKGCILNSRILWFFSAAARQLNRPDLLEQATHAYRFLVDHCLDTEEGGVYWSLGYDGTVKDSTKHTYNQAFAIYALSAYYQASNDPKALALARGLYCLVEERCTDAGGYGEAYDRAFQPVDNDKLSENGVLATRTMNTLLHVFEGYSGLYQAAEDEAVATSMRRILELYKTKVYNPAKRRQEVFFDAGMNSLLDMHSYGHDIESSWLIDWGCSLLGDDALSAQVAAINASLAEEVYRTGYHKHSVWNEQVNGREDTHRIWWVQAEAMVGFAHQYEKTGEEQYRQAVRDIWGYINTCLVDKRPGSEWFWQVDDDGRPDEAKPIVEPWKCPYHNGRMCLELMRRNFDAAP